MAARGFVVVIVGASSEVGRELREILAERAFPVAEWRLYDDAQAVLELVEDAGAPVDPVGEADFAGADFVFLCGAAERARAVADDAAVSGALVVDLTQTLMEDDAVPLVVPEVNAAAVAAALDDRCVATPLPAATALAVVLAPLERAARLRRVSVTCLEPVSSAAGGVEELARQTGELLGGREPSTSLWPARIAFNLIPQVGEIVATGATEREWQIQRQLRHVLDLPDLPISVNVVRVPTFYGQGMVVGVETEEAIDTDFALSVLRQAPGVRLHEGESESSSYPTLSDAVGSEATHVGRVREDPTVPCGVTFWVVIDGLRKGAAVNAAQIAECAVRELRARS